MAPEQSKKNLSHIKPFSISDFHFEVTFIQRTYQRKINQISEEKQICFHLYYLSQVFIVLKGTQVPLANKDGLKWLFNKIITYKY